MLSLLAASLLLQVQVNANTSRDSAGSRSVNIGVNIGGTRGDSARRIPVTPALMASAFHDASARALLAGARAARSGQDSALRTYDAKVFQRISAGLAVRATGRDRLMIRDEGVARVQYDRRAGVVVDMLGKRTTVPMADDPEQDNGEGMRNRLSLPIPYFPGRETLWMGSSIAQMSVDEGSFIHPLAAGSEAYYKYATGDSVEFMLPNGKRILLRELRIEARQPHWNLIVGSFWFDQANSQLVRAVYRPAVELDIWQVATEESQRDSSENAPAFVRGIISPFKISIEVFTVEYSLFEGQFWFPSTQGFEGKAQMSLIRVPATFEERFVYTSVNRPVDVTGPMAAAPALLPTFNGRALRDSLVKTGISRAHVDSIVSARSRAFYDSQPGAVRNRALRDSLTRRGLSARAVDSALLARRRIALDSLVKTREARRAACKAAPDSVVARHLRAYNETLDVLLRTPCDLNSLRNSPELPKSAYDPGEEVFGSKERDRLLGALDFGLQAGWGPQKVGVDWGLGQSRYNRVEGFSTGIALRQELGRGFGWAAQLRGSQGDKQVNAELGIDRSNGRATLGLNVYRRLVSANDWGTPLTLSASLPGLLYARDEGFYYRAWGAELTRTSDRHGQLTMRVFAEEESRSPVTTRFSLFGGQHDSRFVPNIDSATKGAYAGGSLHWGDSWGLAPTGFRTVGDLRLEAAGGATNYGRSAIDLTTSHPIIGPLKVAVTGAAGASLGQLPAQREWFLGGTQTIRGETAGTEHGNAFWFERTELAWGKSSSYYSVFADMGWAGSRDSDWGKSQRLMSGVGIGSSFLDGLIRSDLARGLAPTKQWRFSFSLDARF